MKFRLNIYSQYKSFILRCHAHLQLGKKITYYYSLWSTSEILFILLMWCTVKSSNNPTVHAGPANARCRCVKCDRSCREKENIRHSATKRRPHGLPAGLSSSYEAGLVQHGCQCHGAMSQRPTEPPPPLETHIT
jgi:hypothetical protein